MTSQKPLRRLPLAAAVCAALLSSLPACAATPASSSSSVQLANDPAKVEKNASTGIARITLSQRAIDRLQLLTDTAKPVPGGAGVLLPYAALLYDAQGKTWVYVNTEPRVYQRQAVTVTKVEAGAVTASAGPAAGTVLVTVGAAELFGAEFNTGK
jgi:ABC-type oligopeptide transport system substrate-binding subunit